MIFRSIGVAVLAVSLLLALSANAQAADSVSFNKATLNQAAQLRDKAALDNTAWQVLESLTTEVGPRMAASAGDARAVAWAEAKFKALGFDQVWTQPVTFPLWSRGEEKASVVAPFAQPLSVTTLGYSVGTNGPLKADIVHFASYEDLLASPPNSAAGKIVFISKRMTRARDGAGYGPAVVARGKGAMAAADKGAVAILIRSIGTDSHRLPHTGVMAAEYRSFANKIPAAALSNPDADQLERMLARNTPITVELELGAETRGEYTSFNVIGDIVGREKPDEIVVIGGHLDSWDLGTGAIDDGAGVALTMAAGHLIGQMQQRPKRTLRVIAFANEEQGLWGAKAYAKAQAAQISLHITGAESDFGAGPIYAIESRVKPQALPLVKQIHSVLAPLGIELRGNVAGPGPDLIPLAAAGMSVFALKQDGTDYFDLHHTADDTLDKVNPKHLQQNTAAYTAFAWLVANAPGDFGFGLQGGEGH